MLDDRPTRDTKAALLVNDGAIFEDLDRESALGCPICRRSGLAGERSIAAFAYEPVNDPTLRAELRSSLGFCREHANDAAGQTARRSPSRSSAQISAATSRASLRPGSPSRRTAHARRVRSPPGGNATTSRSSASGTSPACAAVIHDHCPAAIYRVGRPSRVPSPLVRLVPRRGAIRRKRIDSGPRTSNCSGGSRG